MRGARLGLRAAVGSSGTRSERGDEQCDGDCFHSSFPPVMIGNGCAAW
jgi:hypothetical protein